MKDIPAQGDHEDVSRRLGRPTFSSAGRRSIRHLRASYSRLLAPPEVASLAPVGDSRCQFELRAPTRARHWRPYFAAAGLFWALPAGLLLVGYLALPDYITSGQCQGSVFGCALTPKNATVVLAIYVYPLLFIAGWLIMALIALGSAWRHRSRWLSRKATARPCSTRQPCKHQTAGGRVRCQGRFATADGL